MERRTPGCVFSSNIEALFPWGGVKDEFEDLEVWLALVEAAIVHGIALNSHGRQQGGVLERVE